VSAGKSPLALAGMDLWGIDMGVRERLLKATMAGFIHSSRRSTGFGIFDTGFGVAWLIGSITFGRCTTGR
jgi:hypothetical protein